MHNVDVMSVAQFFHYLWKQLSSLCQKFVLWSSDYKRFQHACFWHININIWNQEDNVSITTFKTSQRNRKRILPFTYSFFYSFISDIATFAGIHQNTFYLYYITLMFKMLDWSVYHVVTEENKVLLSNMYSSGMRSFLHI